MENIRASLSLIFLSSQIKVAFDWNKLWVLWLFTLAGMHGALTHSAHTNFWWDVSTSTREFNNQQDTNNVWWLFCIDNPRPTDYAQKERRERVKRIIISPISRIILFLLIPRTWPPWKFNISSYCRCSYVAVHHRVLFWLCASLLNTCTWEMDAFLLETHQYHESLGSRRSGCRETSD